MKKLQLLFCALAISASLIAQIGLPDPSFGNNGAISETASQNEKFGYQFAMTCLVDPGGNIFLVLQAGNTALISKRLPSGLPNPAYGQNCFSAAVFMNVTSAALQADGKIVIAGTPNGGDDFMLARYRVNGDLDSSFGNFGIVISDRGSEQEFLNSVAIIDGGKILVGGTVLTNNSSQFTLVRFLADGKPDQSFGKNGGISTDIGLNFDMRKMLVQPDKKILAVGNTAGKFGLVRYNADGTPDSGFGVGGKITHGFGFNDIANSVAIDATGKIYVGGTTYDLEGTRHFRIAKLNNHGTLDLAYNGGLGSIKPIFANAYDDLKNICLQNDGSVIGSGQTNPTNGDQVIQLTRIKPDGTIDRNFGNNGVVLAGSDTTIDYAYYLIVLPDGKILTGGSSRNINSFSGQRYSCVRFLENGSPDTNFVGAGSWLDFFPRSLFTCNAISLQSDGQLLAAIQLNFDQGTSLFLKRFTADGHPDVTFGQNGKKLLPTELIGSASFQPDGKLIHAGYLSSSPGDIILLRYNVDGTPDISFGSGGNVVTDLGGTESTGPLAFQADGKIILGGFSSEGERLDWLIIRYNPNGSIDSSFGTNGYVRKNFLIQNTIQYITIAPDGKIVLGGRGYTHSPDYSYTRSDMLFARLNTDGTFDTAFNDHGTTVINRSPTNYLGSLNIQKDGKVVFGYVLTAGPGNETVVERLKVDGTP
ncbi:MAG: hypothetical protein Q7T76_16700, partial [Ferruginibacter sp.]|nr:hypothetical protein [Ferruginibacter sp.]